MDFKHGCPRVKTIIGTHNHSRGRLIIPIRCKCWDCVYCKRINLSQLLDRIRRGRPTKLLTLTCQPLALETPALCYQRHRPLIRRLLQEIRRNFGPIEACIICELTARGYPHWHIVCRCPFIPQAWLSRTWLRLTGSRVVDIRKIKNDRHAACYVAKYVTKVCGKNRPDWLKRIVQFTKHYAPRIKAQLPLGFTWKLAGASPEFYLEEAEREKLSIVTFRFGYFVTPGEAPLPAELDRLIVAEAEARPP